jgi:8-oxo-dGTP diphosphatase
MIHEYSHEDKLLAAVDCIIFGFDQKAEELKLLLVKRDFDPEKGKWSLMGGFLRNDEKIEEAASRVLFTLTGLKNIYMEQLNVFSEVDRDPVERTISVAYYALIQIEGHDEELTRKYSACWFELSKVPNLIFDHNIMVQQAISRLRHQASSQPVGFELLPEKFTMRQLQILYEEIFSQRLDKRNFIKKINALDILEKLSEKDKNSSRKGSFLYRFNQDKYQKKSRNGFVFKL